MDLNINKPVPGAKEFYPLNEPSIGTALSPVRVCVLGLILEGLCRTHRSELGHLPQEQKIATTVRATDNSWGDIPESYFRRECTVTERRVTC
jgi:hypothetical protein